MINGLRIISHHRTYNRVLLKSSCPNHLTMATMTPTECPYVVREGEAEIHFKSKSDAFYNPVQEFNRDMR